MRIFSDMCNFRRGVSAPGEDNLGVILTSEEQSISDYILSADIRVVRELH